MVVLNTSIKNSKIVFLSSFFENQSSGIIGYGEFKGSIYYGFGATPDVGQRCTLRRPTSGFPNTVFREAENGNAICLSYHWKVVHRVCGQRRQPPFSAKRKTVVAVRPIPCFPRSGKRLIVVGCCIQLGIAPANPFSAKRKTWLLLTVLSSIYEGEEFGVTDFGEIMGGVCFGIGAVLELVRCRWWSRDFQKY